MHFHPHAIAAVFLSFASTALAEPLSNEDLLVLRTAERIVEETSPTRSPILRSGFVEAMELMQPILERPLPAERPVWIALGRWAVGANSEAAGAVVLAGLRREVPDFMADETLADIAARLNANARTRELAPRAADRLDAGETPFDAYSELHAVVEWHTLADQMAIRLQSPVAAAAGWAGLAVALDRADLSDLAETVRRRAERSLAEIEDPEPRALALLGAAEGQLRFGAIREARTSIASAREHIEALPDGPGRAALQADAARLLAHAGEFDAASDLAAAVDPALVPGLPDTVRLEIVRANAANANLAAAEAAITPIRDPQHRDLALIALIEGLAKAGRDDEARTLTNTLRDPLSQAEAEAMLAAHSAKNEADPQRWRRLLDQAEPSDRRAEAIIRMIEAFGADDPDETPLGRDLYNLAQLDLHRMTRDEREATALSMSRTAFERVPGNLSAYLSNNLRRNDGEETGSRYSLLANAAGMLEGQPD